MKKSLLPVCLFALTAAAQGPGAVEAVKAALNLTDTQVTEFQNLRTAARQAGQPIVTQIQDRQKSLQEAMAKTTPDAATVGRLTVEIKGLHDQLRLIDEKYYQQAVAKLTADQKTKLKALEDAAKLRDAIAQAVGLNLLQPPADAPGIGRGAEGPGMRGGFGGGGKGPMPMGRAPRR